MKRHGWSDDAAEHLDAFRAEVAVDVDVDVAWVGFEEAVVPVSQRAVAPRMAWLGAVAVLAAALAVAWLAIPSPDVAVERDAAEQQARDEAVEHDAAVAPVQGPRRPGAVAPHDAEPPVAPSGLASDTDPEASKPPRRRSKPSGPDAEGTGAGAESVEPEPSRLAEELRLLEGMRAATKTGHHAEALEFVRAHAHRFADGPFAAERELTRVRALCGLGRHDAVREAKARFVAAFPSSHLGSVVRATCKETSRSDHDE